MSVAGQRYVRDRFRADSVIGSLEALYTSLVGQCRA